MLLLGAWRDVAVGGLVPLRPEDTGLGFRVWCWCAPAASEEMRLAVTRAAGLTDGAWSPVVLQGMRNASWTASHSPAATSTAWPARAVTSRRRRMARPDLQSG